MQDSSWPGCPRRWPSPSRGAACPTSAEPERERCTPTRFGHLAGPTACLQTVHLPPSMHPRRTLLQRPGSAGQPQTPRSWHRTVALIPYEAPFPASGKNKVTSQAAGEAQRHRPGGANAPNQGGPNRPTPNRTGRHRNGDPRGQPKADRTSQTEPRDPPPGETRVNPPRFTPGSPRHYSPSQ